MSNPKRLVVKVDEKAFRPYDRYGQPIAGMTWLPISQDKESGAATFYLRFAPGARSRPHEHVEREEFLVLEGRLIDHDGKVFEAGDFVTYDAGSKHSSYAPDGCLLLAILRSHNRTLGEGENTSNFA